jgi:hypothetical protein
LVAGHRIVRQELLLLQVFEHLPAWNAVCD